MKILHYSLGCPPYRTGGMIKFCIDLMKEQVKSGHVVALIWPGRFGILSKKTNIINNPAEKIDGSRFESYEIINPLPVPYDEGIKAFDNFMSEGDYEQYSAFLDDFKPDIIHVHTLMGLHKNFLIAAKNKNIRLVFTAHDFFPICPKVTMYRNGRVCETIESCGDCGNCNSTALSLYKIKALQSSTYKKLKDTDLVKKIRKHHRDNYFRLDGSEQKERSVGKARDYIRLRKFYESMINLMDIIHYNSYITKHIYEKYLNTPNGIVIFISHSDIKNHKKIKKFSDTEINIRYLGTYSGAKGFFYLRDTLDKVWDKKKNFYLNIHFDFPENVPYVKTHKRYTYNELEYIFDNTDVLVVPSIWYETYGYTVLEALSYGVPVIISNTVGAKDIIVDGASIKVNISENSDDLYNAFLDLNAQKLRIMNKNIFDNQNIIIIDSMAKEIEDKCYK